MDGTAAMAELRANDLDFDCLCDDGGAKAWLVGIMAARAAVVERSATDFILSYVFDCLHAEQSLRDSESNPVPRVTARERLSLESRMLIISPPRV